MFQALAIAGTVAVIAYTYIAAVWLVQRARARARHHGTHRHYYRA